LNRARGHAPTASSWVASLGAASVSVINGLVGVSGQRATWDKSPVTDKARVNREKMDNLRRRRAGDQSVNARRDGVSVSFVPGKGTM
jgi:hypothetical protein